MVEHLSAHTAKGRIASIDGWNVGARFWYSLDWLRRNIVWPMYFWFPNMYYLTHTHHHHVENNGPADWQSTLRYDFCSVFDLAKTLLWAGFAFVCPIDTARYFKVQGKAGLMRLLNRSCIHGYLLFLVVLFVAPAFTVTILILYLSGIWALQVFNFSWHGFHDVTRPYEIEASNNSISHYAHHKKPGVHLFSTEIKQIGLESSEQKDKIFAFHKSNSTYAILTNHWLLLQALLWQHKFNLVRRIINCAHLEDSELHRLVMGNQLLKRTAKLEVIDRKISTCAGKFVEQIALPRVSSDYKAVLSDLVDSPKQQKAG